jgi:sugar phosphate isomerase/epimerase
MNSKMNNLLIILLAAVFICVVFTTSLTASQSAAVLTEHPETDTYQGWKIGVQAWSFRKYSFFEAIDKAASLGVERIQAYPGQKLTPDMPKLKFIHTMDENLRKVVKDKLAQTRVKLASYGVVNMPQNRNKCRQLFEFAKDMGIETIVSEPSEKSFEMIDQFCNEFQIKVAVHNHPKPSKYWNPDKVLEVCKGRSKMIGACADTGHWVRSGLDPVECLKKLEGRIINLHFKEIDDGHDVIWGTAENRTLPMLQELHRQGFKGTFSVEYEYNWEKSVPEIRQSIANFEAIAAELKTGGYQRLIDDQLSKWIFKPGTWFVEDGKMTLKGGGYIWSKETFGDFILDLDFKVAKNGNSGVFFRTSDHKDIVNTGIEVQIHDTTDGYKYGMCGAIYDCLPPKVNAMKPGKWNRMTLMAYDNMIYVVMNGKQIIEMNLDKWTEPGKNPNGTKNKFKYAYKDIKRSGHIGLQDHGDDIWFRNVKIKKLN